MKNVESDQLFEICQNIPDAVCIMGTDWIIRHWNRGAEAMFEYPADEIIGQSIVVIIPEDIARKEIEHCTSELNAKGKMPAYETVRIAKDGRIIPIEMTAIALKKDGAVNGYAAIMRDITERKRTEEALKLTQFSVDHASVSAFLVGRDARFLYVNEQACRTLGYTRQEMLSMAVYDLDPNFPSTAWDDHWKQLKEKGSLHFETLHRKKDATLIPVEVSANYVSFAGREYNWGFASDITGRRQAEQRLRARETQLSLIYDGVYDIIFVIGVEPFDRFRFISVNRRFLEATGLPESRVAGRLVEEVIPEPSYSLVLEKYKEAVRSGQSIQWEEVTVYPSGEKVGEVNVTPVFDARGACTQLIGTVHDVTELKRAQGNLQRAYEELEIKVRERTRDLARTNEELNVEITERRRAVDLIRKSKDLGDALNDINTVIHSTLDFEEVMKRVVKEAALAIKVESSAIGLIHDTTFQIRYVHNMAEHFAGWSVPLDQLTGVRSAAASGDTLAFNDAANDERLNLGFVHEWGIKSMLVSPLIIKKRMAGAIVFYSFSNPTVFEQEHIDFARKLGASISLALENADLYHALQESRALSESRLTQLRTIYETAPVGLCFIDRSMRYVSINRRLAEINGVPVEETVGRSIREIVADEAAARTIVALCNRAIETGMPIENVEVARKKDLIVLANYYPVRDHAGTVVGVNIVVQDITERKRAEEKVRASERLLKAHLNSIPDIAWLKDSESRFILVNEPFGKACGKEPDELVGKTDFDAWPRDLAEKYRADDFEVMKSRLQKRVEEPLAPIGGPVRLIETIKTPIYNEEGAVIGTAGIARDTTERKRMEEEIRHMALHDPLTGLPNRRMFLDILNLEIAQARRHKKKLAVLFLDLDRFKEINDTLGHDVGDRLLMHVAGRFRNTLRESDTVARIGGDEFNMVLADITRSDAVSEIALKIVNSLGSPIVLNGHELHISTSAGISIYPDDSEEVETLLRYADIAMYDAKEHGRNTFRFYNPSINIRSLERMKLESYLRQAVKRGELSVLYQPLIDIKSKKICYAEALVRWNHPDRGILDPKEFIPLAEETGFITKIDEWVLRTVCRQAKSWKNSGLQSFCVTVNLSARQFQSPGLVQLIASVLRETGMPPSCLDLEVTESTAMSNVERTAGQLRELRDMEIHISIDDFGTGYSSLNYLKKLPIERLKIDKSFVQDIARDPDDRAIISAVTSMARKMGIRTVAEGVETEEQLEFLRLSKCDEAQGFLFSRPVPAEQFRDLVTAGG